MNQDFRKDTVLSSNKDSARKQARGRMLNDNAERKKKYQLEKELRRNKKGVLIIKREFINR